MRAADAIFASFLGFHGSDRRFDVFNKTLANYDDDGLSLTASPLVAAEYGRYIYCVECKAVRLKRLSLASWRQTNDAEAEVFQNGGLDGFIINCDSSSESSTFWAETIIVWSIEKCAVRGCFEHQLGDDIAELEVRLGRAPRDQLSFQQHHALEPPLVLAQAAKELTSHATRWLARQHIKVQCDVGHSPAAWIESILEQSRERSGGKVEQHLVGAKLEERHPGIKIPNHPANAGDKQTGRAGDFVVGSTAYHVTAAPAREVIQRCASNLAAGVHPVLLVPKTLVPQTILRAENEELGARITVIAIEDFLALNIIEMTAGDQRAFRAKLAAIIVRYNRRLLEVETDPSLSIDLA